MKRVGLVVGLLAAALLGAVAVRHAVSNDENALVITHWSNSHPMRDDLLADMAAEFNHADHETASGRPIEIRVLRCDSAVQAADLVARVSGAGAAERGCKNGDAPAADPTIVTPQSGDWLVDVNHEAGRDVIDLESTEHLAETWLGIVTYRAMAECLGWPQREIGYADIEELRADPQGWAAYPDCAQTDWGRVPLLAFTNPSTSTSGRNVLVSLYSIAAGKPPAELTVDDVQRDDVVQYVKKFQDLVDHYLPGTIELNTKIVQGEHSGHFFLMPEDNLVSLAKGNEQAIGSDGTPELADARTDLVMIYPKEGSVLNSNPAGIVHASWVTDEAAAAASQWIEFLRSENQQRRFMDAGFRPARGTGLAPDPERFSAWGLDASAPASKIEPGDLQPAVLDEIIGSWALVKNPAIVTLVVDTSGSMRGEPLARVKDGLSRLLEAMRNGANEGSDTQVGLVTFADDIGTEIAPKPLRDARFEIADAIDEMKAGGSTALYDAIARAVELTSAADGSPEAKRAVVVLSDGEATDGRCLDAVVEMMTRDEVPVSQFCGQEGDEARDADGRTMAAEDISGDRLLSADDVSIFFVGFGDADVQIGRILAEATGADYRGSTDQDLATVIEALSGYF
jgi:Ca-activated chloride channel family protein